MATMYRWVQKASASTVENGAGKQAVIMVMFSQIRETY